MRSRDTYYYTQYKMWTITQLPRLATEILFILMFLKLVACIPISMLMMFVLVPSFPVYEYIVF